MGRSLKGRIDSSFEASIIECSFSISHTLIYVLSNCLLLSSITDIVVCQTIFSH